MTKCQACPNDHDTETVTLVNESTIRLCRGCAQVHASLIVEPILCWWCGEDAVTLVDSRRDPDGNPVKRDACEECGERETRLEAQAKRLDIEECRGDYARDLAKDNELEARR